MRGSSTSTRLVGEAAVAAELEQCACSSNRYKSHDTMHVAAGYSNSQYYDYKRNMLTYNVMILLIVTNYTIS
jgi:hypothetical protein